MTHETLEQLVEDYFSNKVVTQSPFLIGSLTALLDLLITDVENGETIRLHYYKRRVKELSEEYPDLYFPRTK